MHRRSFLALVSATAAATTLAACQTGPSGDSGASASSPSGAGSSGSAAGAFPVTIKHALGSTTIEQKPTRVATLGWSDADMVLALGVVPVGCPKITWGGNKNESTDSFDKALAKIGGQQPTRYSDADGAPVDEIAKLRPDLILATNSGVTKEEYARLSKIAPVIAYPGEAYGTSWQDGVKLAGQALGLEGKAKQVTAATEKAIRDAVAKYPAIKGKTASWLMIQPTDLSKFAAYTTLDNRPRMLENLGMKNAPIVTQLSKGKKTFSVDISSEKASTLDADVVVFYIEKPGEEKTFTSHPLIGQIPALKDGAYVATLEPGESYFMSSPTPLTIPEGLPRLLPKLQAAATKAK